MKKCSFKISDTAHNMVPLVSPVCAITLAPRDGTRRSGVQRQSQPVPGVSAPLSGYFWPPCLPMAEGAVGPGIALIVPKNTSTAHGWPENQGWLLWSAVLCLSPARRARREGLVTGFLPPGNVSSYFSAPVRLRHFSFTHGNLRFSLNIRSIEAGTLRTVPNPVRLAISLAGLETLLLYK